METNKTQVALQQYVATLRSQHSAAHQRVTMIQEHMYNLAAELNRLTDALREVEKIISELPVEEPKEVIPMPEWDFIDSYVNDNYYDVVRKIQDEGIERNWDLSDGWGDEATITCNVEVDGGVVEEQICNVVKGCVEAWIEEWKGQQIEKAMEGDDNV